MKILKTQYKKHKNPSKNEKRKTRIEKYPQFIAI